MVRALFRRRAAARAPSLLSSASQEDHFRSAFTYSAIGMALVSLEGRWLAVNQSVSAMLGYTPEELLQTTFQALTHPDDLAACPWKLRLGRFPGLASAPSPTAARAPRQILRSARGPWPGRLAAPYQAMVE